MCNTAPLMLRRRGSPYICKIYEFRFLLFCFIGAVGGEGGDEDDKEKEEEAERERQEAIREAEERRKEKHRKMEEEREKMRQEIRDKVRNRAIPLIARVNYPTNPQLSLRDITCEVDRWSYS